MLYYVIGRLYVCGGLAPSPGGAQLSSVERVMYYYYYYYY